VTQAQHLAGIEPLARQLEIAAAISEEALSVAETARLCDALRHNANIDPFQALDMLRRGEQVPNIVMRVPEQVPQMRAATELQAEAPWEYVDDEDEREPDEPLPWIGYEPVTRDGNSVMRIHSLDSFMDELQRLTECLQNGDLQRLSLQDPQSAVKLRLAARQARYLADALAGIIQPD